VDEEPCARPCKLVCLTGGGRSLRGEAYLMLDEGIPIRDGKIVRADPETTRIGLPHLPFHGFSPKLLQIPPSTLRYEYEMRQSHTLTRPITFNPCQSFTPVAQ